MSFHNLQQSVIWGKNKQMEAPKFYTANVSPVKSVGKPRVTRGTP